MRTTVSPIALLCGGLSFGLLILQSMVAMAVLPHLDGLFRTSPRLAMLAILGLIAFPGLFVLVVHTIGVRFIDKDKSILPTFESWWAAALAWMVVYGTTLLTQIVMLVINPPPPEDESFGVASFVHGALTHASPANAVSIYAGLWILIASVLYELERRTRKA